MDKLADFWNGIKSAIKSRTIWGMVVFALGVIGVDVNGVEELLVNAGDHLVVFAGAVLALVGYFDRREKRDVPVATAATLPPR